MGWASGSYIMQPVIDALKAEVKDDATRKRIYLSIIPAFEQEDWDTQDECLGTDDEFDAALKELHPSWFEAG